MSLINLTKPNTTFTALPTAVFLLLLGGCNDGGGGGGSSQDSSDDLSPGDGTSDLSSESFIKPTESYELTEITLIRLDMEGVPATTNSQLRSSPSSYYATFDSNALWDVDGATSLTVADNGDGYFDLPGQEVNDDTGKLSFHLSNKPIDTSFGIQTSGPRVESFGVGLGSKTESGYPVEVGITAYDPLNNGLAYDFTAAGKKIGEDSVSAEATLQEVPGRHAIRASIKDTEGRLNHAQTVIDFDDGVSTWPYAGMNVQRTASLSTLQDHHAVGSTKWKVDGVSAHSRVAIDSQGDIYSGDGRDDYFYAVDHDNKTILWDTKLSGTVKSSPVIGENGAILVGDSLGNFYSMAPDDGSINWEFKAGDGFWASAAVGPSGTIYAPSLDETLYALDPTSGEIVWKYDVGGDIHSSPVVSANGILYVGSRSDYLVAIDVETGEEVFTAFGYASDGSPAIGPDGTVYAGNNAGMFSAFDGQTGEVKWEREFSTESWPLRDLCG